MLTPPSRGFQRAEFEQRLQRLQKDMHEQSLDYVILTDEPNVRYFSGFFSQFWLSPTRPWFLLIPAEGEIVAVIPEIGRAGMADTWVQRIATWPSPQPHDDGISLLRSEAAKFPARHGRVGMTLGAESIVRMPVLDYQRLAQGLGAEMVDVSTLLCNIRMIKSPAEIAKTRHICHIASDAFNHLPSYAKAQMSEREICMQMRIDLLQRGADDVPFLVAGSGQGGYDSIIMGPGDRQLEEGDVLIIDTGSTHDGYFCDFDRNFAFGHADDEVKRAYEVVFKATDAGFAAARPGAKACDLYHAMNEVMAAAGALGNDVGRLGHGLGMQLTERPSNTAIDDTELKPGMIMTLEPGMTFAKARNMVHEENIVITEDGAEWLSKRASAELPIIR